MGSVQGRDDSLMALGKASRLQCRIAGVATSRNSHELPDRNRNGREYVLLQRDGTGSRERVVLAQEEPIPSARRRARSAMGYPARRSAGVSEDRIAPEGGLPNDGWK